jgi:thiol-disulfide isomerase/thioredoxin
MTKKLIFIALLLVVFSCKKAPSTIEMVQENDSVEVYNYSELAPLLNKVNPEKTYIINFWATWCAPCIKELPYFQELHDTNKNIEVILVSLDFPEKLETQLIPFIKKKNLTPQVILLNDPNENQWIPAIDSTWSGALPATLIYNKEKRAFYKQSFTKESLLKEVEKFTKV